MADEDPELTSYFSPQFSASQKPENSPVKRAFKMRVPQLFSAAKDSDDTPVCLRPSTNPVSSQSSETSEDPFPSIPKERESQRDHVSDSVDSNSDDCVVKSIMQKWTKVKSFTSASLGDDDSCDDVPILLLPQVLRQKNREKKKTLKSNQTTPTNIVVLSTQSHQPLSFTMSVKPSAASSMQQNSERKRNRLSLRRRNVIQDTQAETQELLPSGDAEPTVIPESEDEAEEVDPKETVHVKEEEFLTEIEILNEPGLPGDSNICQEKQWSNQNDFIKQMLPCDPSDTIDVININEDEPSNNTVQPTQYSYEAEIIESTYPENFGNSSKSPVNDSNDSDQELILSTDNIMADQDDQELLQSVDVILQTQLPPVTPPVNSPSRNNREAEESPTPSASEMDSNSRTSSSVVSIYESYEESEEDIFSTSYSQADPIIIGDSDDDDIDEEQAQEQKMKKEDLWGDDDDDICVNLIEEDFDQSIFTQELSFDDTAAKKEEEDEDLDIPEDMFGSDDDFDPKPAAVPCVTQEPTALPKPEDNGTAIVRPQEKSAQPMEDTKPEVKDEEIQQPVRKEDSDSDEEFVDFFKSMTNASPSKKIMPILIDSDSDGENSVLGAVRLDSPVRVDSPHERSAKENTSSDVINIVIDRQQVDDPEPQPSTSSSALKISKPSVKTAIEGAESKPLPFTLSSSRSNKSYSESSASSSESAREKTSPPPLLVEEPQPSTSSHHTKYIHHREHHSTTQKIMKTSRAVHTEPKRAVLVEPMENNRRKSSHRKDRKHSSDKQKTDHKRSSSKERSSRTERTSSKDSRKEKSSRSKKYKSSSSKSSEFKAVPSVPDCYQTAKRNPKKSSAPMTTDSQVCRGISKAKIDMFERQRKQKKESREKRVRKQPEPTAESSVSPAEIPAKRRRTVSKDEHNSDVPAPAVVPVPVETTKPVTPVTISTSVPNNSHNEDKAPAPTAVLVKLSKPSIPTALTPILFKSHKDVMAAPAPFPLSLPFTASKPVTPSLPMPSPIGKAAAGGVIRSSMPMPVKGMKSRPTSEDFILKIIAWNPVWLEEHQKLLSLNRPSTPPGIAKIRGPLLSTYNSLEDYMESMTPLLLLETWEKLYRQWEETLSRNRRLESYEAVKRREDIINRKSIGKMIKIIFHVPRREQQKPLAESDLVILKLKSRSSSGQSVQEIFGYVSLVTPLRNHADIDPRVGHYQSKRGPSTVQCAEIKVNYRSISIQDNEFHTVQVLDNLISQVRQYDGLCLLQWNTLATDILRPVNDNVFKMSRAGTELHANLKKCYNRDQSLAISSLTSAVQELKGISKIALLQGPPGTGKSHTIVGLITNLIAQQTRERCRILLCAPSNGAVDEICKKIITCRTPGIRRPVVVRLSSAQNKLHPTVSECSLEKAILREFHREFRSKLTGSHATALDDIEAQINKTKKRMQILAGKPSEANDLQFCRMKGELEKLNKKKAPFLPKSELNHDQKMVYGRKAVLRADVICATLNYCGSTMMSKLLSMNNVNNPNDPGCKALVPFTVAIVDEAGQSIELDNLIPLKFSVTKLILVGDQEQLPPTVLCQKAAEMNFGQSLFERLSNHLSLASEENESSSRSPVLMLREQYRMHPDICHFPNLYVYNNQLITPKNIQEHRSRFPYINYRVFDLQYSRERQESGGTWNPDEGDFVVELCSEIVTDMQRNSQNINIGIIAPYSKQKQYIQRRLNEKNLNSVECGTVDGFQGREKDIIFLSCVRAKAGGPNKGIGFLADRRRMNVALTRAKFALFIVAHCKSLRVSVDWDCLINDAEKRKALTTIDRAPRIKTIVNDLKRK